MTDASEQAPVWAQDEALPEAAAGWGWLDRRGRRHECAGLAGIEDALRQRGGSVRLVWTPQNPRMVVPEELGEVTGVLAEVTRRDAVADLREGRVWLAGCGVAALAAAATAYARGGIQAVMASGWVGTLLLLGLMFGAIPCYRGWKERRRLGRGATADPGHVAEARFEAWLGLQRAPVTWLLLGLMALAGMLQLVLPGEAWRAAGLLKVPCRAGEWWRLFTAPWLHGHPVHWLMNASALLYLGRRTEVLARWPHLAVVFLFAAWLGGIASLRWVIAPSVGASGGLLGLLGFLLAFETLHRRLVPVSARRRLLAGVIATALIGLLGFRFIDNAAHAGGLVAGLLYGAIVFPPSSSPLQPRTLGRDRIVGALALAVLVASAALACWKAALAP